MALTTIGDELRIGGTDTLLSSRGLDNLDLVGGPLTISNNEHLVEFDSLASVPSHTGELQLRFDDRIERLVGLAGLVPVTGDLDRAGARQGGREQPVPAHRRGTERECATTTARRLPRSVRQSGTTEGTRSRPP